MTFNRFDSSRDHERLAALSSAAPALVFKHSPTCGVSTRAMQEVCAFRIRWPQTPVFLVDVLAERPLSLCLAHDLEVGHASPQVILVRGGRAVWSESHWRIAADAIAEAVSTTGGATFGDDAGVRRANADRR